MNIKEQFVKALFDKSVKEKAAQMFQDNFEFNGFKDRLPLELFDISFRLFKPTENYVNLEFLASSNFGHYFQPVGMYDRNNNISLFNELEETYQTLNSTGQITDIPKLIDKKANALMAAFSMQTIKFATETLQEFSKHGWESEIKNEMMIPATMRYDKRFESNGFNCELLFSNQGYPQFYLDDEHGVEGAIGAYIPGNDGKLSIHPTVEYKGLFDKLHQLRLLTALNKI